jgi:ferrous iron transport protein B
MKTALVGNQNSGKTTLFNLLTGSNQKIGNWPGVTIERKEGTIKGSKISIVDLPGIYSLSPYTSEEDVSRIYIMEEKPDLIINIIDSTSLERSLYLTTQLLELNVDVVIALNMSDILLQNGIEININKLSESLGCSIIPISAKKNTGVKELIDLIKSKNYIHNQRIKIYPPDVEETITKAEKHVPKENELHKRFIAVKMIENDPRYLVVLNEHTKNEIKQIEQKYDMDGEQLIASLRYDYIGMLKKDCLIVHPHKESITDRLDRVLLNKWAAIPIFIVIMGLIYLLSIGIVGGIFTPLLDMLFNADGDITLTISYIFGSSSFDLYFKGLGPLLGDWLSSIGGSPWLVSLVENGIVSGVSSVLGFIPQLFILFIFLSFLEASGYMSRIAFFLDRVFHKFGLSGKSLIPFVVGTGCSVPGIMSTRIVEDENEKKSTIALTPFIPCSAKLPVIALFAGFFFPSIGWLVSLSFYVFAIVLILFYGIIFKKLLFKGEHSSFLSELPAYQMPTFSHLMRDVWDRTWSFIKRAGTVVLLCSVIVWVLASYSWTFQYVASDISQSMLAGIGNAFAWFFYPMLGGHWSWAATASAIQGMIAREQVVSSMSVIASLSGGTSVFTSSAFSFFNGWSAYAYLTFIMFSIPCVATVSSMRKEYGSWKLTLFTVSFQLVNAWVLASLIGGIGWLISL